MHETPRKHRRLPATLAVLCLLAGVSGVGSTARSESAIWPDSRVHALWPTFSTVAVPESGTGGLTSWNGAFRRCVPSRRVPLDYVCQYRDPRGRVGYVCLATREPWDRISPAAITARVAPEDVTYRSASPSQVCVSSLAYTLSLG